jgi:1-pyrroline-5-carboxylate dehydrogenase
MTDGQPTQKITYATLAAPSEELHQAFEAALGRQRNLLGQEHPMYIGGRDVRSDRQFEVRSPSDTRVLIGRFQRGSAEHARQAVDAAQDTARAWANTAWEERVRIVRHATDLVSARGHDLAARLTYEVGKTRMEALGDIEESADFLRYYCDHMAGEQGFTRLMTGLSAGEKPVDLMRPYGVWLVISPFNFPMALAMGPVGAALVAGNTVVLKPSSDAPWLGIEIARILAEAGVPDGAINVVTGSGSEVGQALADDPRIGGMTFTGSYDAGMALYRGFSQRYPRPCIVEMGGKNPTIVTGNADLDKAAEGITRSAFGFSGQKCSACSRVYVDRAVRDELIERLRERTEKLVVGDPSRRETFTGPVIHESKLDDFRRAIDLSLSDGRIIAGGEVLSDGEYAHGYFVRPTVVDGLGHDHELMREEQFMPFVGLVDVDSLDEALTLANDTLYGLTAGIYTEDPDEAQRFLGGIEAGVVYVNRRAGATTGAWPGSQAFGGWKGSASTARGSGGPYYLQQYLREQAQTIIEE